jgi:prepilin-type N-terminal cleavage/methylation domain-containing protein
MRTRFNKGFTLIEIIIVIVIIGVLATLALPKITGQLESARAGEAMSMLGAIKRAADQCFEATNNIASCDTFAELGITTPTGIFTYTANSTTPGTLLVRAVRSGAGAPATPGSICLSFVAGTGVTTFDSAPAGNAYTSVVTKTGSQAAIAGCNAAMPTAM